MSRLLVIGLRQATSTLIGGLIVLIPLLTALSDVTFVSHQLFQYHRTANTMIHYRHERELSERLAIDPPALLADLAWSCE